MTATQTSARPDPRLPDWLRRAGIAVLDALLPPQCLTCDAAVDAQGTLCGTCFSALSFISAPLCNRCGVPLPHENFGPAPAAGGPLCPRCESDPPIFAAARAALRYDAGAARLILPFKHADRTELARPLARHMARAGASLVARADLLVPVPLHRWRLLQRRYNQAALLARLIARRAGKRLGPDLLRRRVATPSLGDRGAAERAALVADAFTLRPGGGRHVAGRRILLIDDVLTSGATAGACARVLLDAGAAGVDVLAAARVPDRRFDRG